MLFANRQNNLQLSLTRGDGFPNLVRHSRAGDASGGTDSRKIGEEAAAVQAQIWEKLQPFFSYDLMGEIFSDSATRRHPTDDGYDVSRCTHPI